MQHLLRVKGESVVVKEFINTVIVSKKNDSVN